MAFTRNASRAVLCALVIGSAACGGGVVQDDLVLDVSPMAITFASVQQGEEVTRNVVMTHVGTSGVIRINQVYVDAGSAPDFSVTVPTVVELKPGEATSAVVHYTPKTPSAAGVLVITHNVPAAYLTRVTLKAAAGFGALISIPDPIDFGSVSNVTEKSKDLDVILKNTGTKPVMVNEVRLKAPDTDFQILEGSMIGPEGKPLPVELTSNDEIGMTMRYTPAGGGCDETELWVLIEGEDSPTAFTVEGCELGPKIVVTPGQVDFAYVVPGETKTISLTIANDGNDDLVVTDISVAQGADPELHVDPTPASSTPSGPWLIKKGESREGVNVSWKALTAHDITIPFDGIRILSNDANAGAVTVPVYGTLDAPDIALVPGDLVDFGVVAQLVATDRTLTIRNDGHGELTVTKIEIDKSKDTLDEFEIVADAAFPPTTGGGPGTVAGFATKGVTLRFTNKGPDTGMVIVPLMVTSNSPGEENLSVDLKAARAGKATCDPILIPGTVNFGNVALGNSKNLSVNVRNKGTGYCTFANARIDDCTAGMFGGATCAAAFKGTLSKAFTIVSLPPGTPKGIGPGMDATITIKYEPPEISTLFGKITNFYGLLGVKVLDSNVSGTPPEIVIPSAATPPHNVLGTAGVPQVSVLPAEVKFGLVTIGCWSKTYQVCLYSTGNAPVTVSDISLSGCSPEFKIKDVPPLPMDVNAGVKKCFGVAYAPQDPGSDACKVTVLSNGKNAPQLDVMLTGEGTYESDQTDKFIQASGQSVDVLFIIDDSGSMCDDQERLVDAYPQFISHASLGNDYHIGVISVNVVKEEVIGKLNRGDPKKQPRYITPNPNSSDQFADLAYLDCNGGSDEQESGLQAAQVALTAPLVTDTLKICNSDSDCVNDPALCGDPKTCPYYCFEGTCGGWNKGFLRDDAQLEMVVLSDEEDQSPSALAFYEDFFKNIKGYYNVGMMHFHAIVWHFGACESESSETDGKRYAQLADHTGGVNWNICGDFEVVMDQIGLKAFQPKVQFFLSRLADPPTVTVKVNGTQCASGWKYDTNSNSVIFDTEGSCMPQPGQEIEVHYKTLCLTS
jgi:hypothetical protein